MADLEEKIGLLEKNGFKYLFDRDAFCDRRTLTCFSLEFVEDHPIEKIKSIINERNDSHNELKCYFSGRPSRSFVEKIEREIEDELRIGGKAGIRSGRAAYKAHK